jgi:hypothetical protein
MEATMLCPQCLSPLESKDQHTATCGVHGEFRVLFSRAELAVPQTIQAIAQGSSAPSAQDLEQPVELPSAQMASDPVSAPIPASSELDLQPVRQTDPAAAHALAALGLAEKPRPVAPGQKIPVPEGKCAKHPKMDSVQICADCQAPMCRMCLYRAPYGKKICPACSGRGAPGGSVAPALEASVASPADKPVNPVMVGVMCRTHPEVQAIHKCKICNAGSCQTCDFKFSGNVHICPVCVMKPRGGLSAKRQNYVIAGYVIAALTFVSYGLGEMQGSSGFMIISLVTCLVGLPVSLAPLEKKLPNTNALWIGMVLNVLFFLVRMLILIMVIWSHR